MVGIPYKTTYSARLEGHTQDPQDPAGTTSVIKCAFTLYNTLFT